MAGRGYKTEAVVLRSLRFGEADRVLHLYTLERGRVGAVAKGIRRTKSRFGGRLEPLSHVELMLHQGSGELGTVTGASLVRAHRGAREESYRLSVGLVGLEAMLRLFTEQERNPKAFEALTRFLDVLDDAEVREAEPALDPLVLSFQLKLLWLSGYLPHLTSCAECGAEGPLVGYSPRSRRRGLPELRCRVARALGRRHRGHRRPARNAARRRGDLEAGRTRSAPRDHVVVRVPRRLPPAHPGQQGLVQRSHAQRQTLDMSAGVRLISPHSSPVMKIDMSRANTSGV